MVQVFEFSAQCQPEISFELEFMQLRRAVLRLIESFLIFKNRRKLEILRNAIILILKLAVVLAALRLNAGFSPGRA